MKLFMKCTQPPVLNQYQFPLPSTKNKGGGGLFILKLMALPQRFPALEHHMGSFKPLVLRLDPRSIPWESTKDPGVGFKGSTDGSSEEPRLRSTGMG